MKKTIVFLLLIILVNIQVMCYGEIKATTDYKSGTKYTSVIQVPDFLGNDLHYWEYVFYLMDKQTLHISFSMIPYEKLNPRETPSMQFLGCGFTYFTNSNREYRKSYFSSVSDGQRRWQEDYSRMHIEYEDGVAIAEPEWNEWYTPPSFDITYNFYFGANHYSERKEDIDNPNPRMVTPFIKELMNSMVNGPEDFLIVTEWVPNKNNYDPKKTLKFALLISKETIEEWQKVAKFTAADLEVFKNKNISNNVKSNFKRK